MLPTAQRLYCSLVSFRYLYIDIMCVLFCFTHDTPLRNQLQTEKKNKVLSLQLNVGLALLYLLGIYILISYVSFFATRMTCPLELNLKKIKIKYVSFLPTHMTCPPRIKSIKNMVYIFFAYTHDMPTYN